MKKSDEIIKRAKELLPKVKSRKELEKKLANEFKISPNTVNVYFHLKKFKTGFPRGGLKLKKYLNDKKENFEKKLDEFYKFIEQKPRYSFELKKYFPYYLKYYKQLKIRNFPIQRTKILGRGQRQGISIGKPGGLISIFYLLNQRSKALNRINDKFPQKMLSLTRPILNGFHNRVSQVREKYQSKAKPNE